MYNDTCALKRTSLGCVKATIPTLKSRQYLSSSCLFQLSRLRYISRCSKTMTANLPRSPRVSDGNDFPLSPAKVTCTRCLYRTDSRINTTAWPSRVYGVSTRTSTRGSVRMFALIPLLWLLTTWKGRSSAEHRRSGVRSVDKEGDGKDVFSDTQYARMISDNTQKTRAIKNIRISDRCRSRCRQQYIATHQRSATHQYHSLLTITNTLKLISDICSCNKNNARNNNTVNINANFLLLKNLLIQARYHFSSYNKHKR